VAIAYFLFNLRKKTLWYAGCILYLLGYMYLLSVRISIVALIVVVFISLISQRKKIPSKYIYLLFIGCALIPVAFYLSPSFQEKFNPHTPEGEPISDVDSRKIHWEAAIDQISQNNILFGAGTGDGHDGLYENYKKFGFEIGFLEQYNAHNQYIETVLYYGIFGLVFLMLLLFYGWKINYKNRDYLVISLILIFAVCII